MVGEILAVFTPLSSPISRISRDLHDLQLLPSRLTMATLLSIPRELRDKILVYVISAGRAAPRDPVTENRTELNDSRVDWRRIMYEKRYNRTAESKITGIFFISYSDMFRKFRGSWPLFKALETSSWVILALLEVLEEAKLIPRV